jgi:hypothetical protein
MIISLGKKERKEVEDKQRERKKERKGKRERDFSISIHLSLSLVLLYPLQHLFSPFLPLSLSVSSFLSPLYGEEENEREMNEWG